MSAELQAALEARKNGASSIREATALAAGQSSGSAPAAAALLPGDVAVIGGGPAGACMAVLLAQRGFTVDVYEMRPDPRVHAAGSSGPAQGGGAFGQSTDAAKRSINLALSCRGQSALAAAGVLESVMRSVVPMPQRAIHTEAGALVAQAYGHPGQAIYSVSRGLVNEALLEACAAQAGVRLHFGAAIEGLDESGLLTLREAKRGAGLFAPPPPYRPRLVIGADGAFSKVRDSLLRHTRMSFSRTIIAHGYKELSIPPRSSEGASSSPADFALPQPHSLHIWPRTQFMLIALPNTDRSFTATLFAPFETFEALDRGGSEAVGDFFAAHFPDVLPHLPRQQLLAQYAANPTSSLMEVKCAPWQHAGRVLLIGDAAHSTVPFYGQGMNAALEDCLCLQEAYDALGAGEGAAAGGGGGGGGGGDASLARLARAVEAFAASRQPAGVALCDLSMGNYDEMKAKTESPFFRLRASVESAVHALLPQWWMPQYSMVAFTRIPYHEVVARVARQEAAVGLALAAAGVALAGALGLALLKRNAFVLSRWLVGEAAGKGMEQVKEAVSRVVRLGSA